MIGPRLVIDALAARFGGTAYAAIQTATHLARSDSFAEVVVVTRKGSTVADGLASDGRLRLFALPAASKGELAHRLAWEVLGLPREIARDEPAAVLTWSGMLPRRLSAPVTSFLANPVMFECDGLANRVRRRAVRRTAAGQCELIAPTAAMATLASEALSVPVSVVPLGVDHDRFSPATEPGREILCVADFYRHKRHDIVLDAWASLPSPRPVLRLIGNPRVDAATHRQVLARIERYQRLGTVTVDRNLRLAELVAAYRRARVFVVASEHESFCMPLLEALACGVPAVARDLPALRETGGPVPGTTYVAGDGAERWGAELHALVHNQDLHQRARTRALEQAARFGWERTATELRDCILRGSHLTAPMKRGGDCTVTTYCD